jgi:hypothetical protein
MIAAAYIASRMSAVMLVIVILRPVGSCVRAAVENVDEVAGIVTSVLDSGEPTPIRLWHSSTEHGECSAVDLGPLLKVSCMRPRRQREGDHVRSSGRQALKSGDEGKGGEHGRDWTRKIWAKVNKNQEDW